MKPGSPAKAVRRPGCNGDINTAQLRRLIEIQSQVVSLARQNERAEKQHQAMQRSLNGRRSVIRRLLHTLAQLARRNRPLDSAS